MQSRLTSILLLVILIGPGTILNTVSADSEDRSADRFQPGRWNAYVDDTQRSRNITVEIYYPSTINQTLGPRDISEAPYPTLVYMREEYEDASEYEFIGYVMARYGAVVVIVDPPGVVWPIAEDRVTLAEDIRVVVTAVLNTNNTTSPIEGMIDGSAIVAGGFGIGGDAAIIAADGDPRILGAVAVAPEGDQAAIDVADQDIPLLVIAGSEDGRFEPVTTSQLLYDATTEPSSMLTFIGANHYQFQTTTPTFTQDNAATINRAQQHQLLTDHLTAFVETLSFRDLSGYQLLWGSNGASGVSRQLRNVTGVEVTYQYHTNLSSPFGQTLITDPVDLEIHGHYRFIDAPMTQGHVTLTMPGELDQIFALDSGGDLFTAVVLPAQVGIYPATLRIEEDLAANTGEPLVQTFSDTFHFRSAYNLPPQVATPILDQTIAEDTDLVLDLATHFGDAEGASLSYTVAADPATITGSQSDDNLTLHPDQNWNGISDITVSASDGEFSANQTFRLTVFAVDDPPTWEVIPANRTTNEDTVAPIDVFGTCSDPDSSGGVFYGISGGAEDATVSMVSGTVAEVDPATDFFGDVTVSLHCADNAQLTNAATTTVVVTVININDAPRVVGSGNASFSDGSLYADISVVETDGPELTVEARIDDGSYETVVVPSTHTTAPSAPRFDEIELQYSASGLELFPGGHIVRFRLDDGEATPVEFTIEFEVPREDSGPKPPANEESSFIPSPAVWMALMVLLLVAVARGHRGSRL